MHATQGLVGICRWDAVRHGSNIASLGLASLLRYFGNERVNVDPIHLGRASSSQTLSDDRKTRVK